MQDGVLGAENCKIKMLGISFSDHSLVPSNILTMENKNK